MVGTLYPVVCLFLVIYLYSVSGLKLLYKKRTYDCVHVITMTMSGREQQAIHVDVMLWQKDCSNVVVPCYIEVVMKRLGVHL